MRAIIALVGFLALTNSAFAGEADCVQLRDTDQRNLCMAQSTRNETYCAAINNEDQRRYCRALVSNRQADCVPISNQELRTYCRGLTR
jgi:hypothetical protein